MADSRKTGKMNRRRVMVLGVLAVLAGCADWASAGPQLVDLSIIDRDSGQVLTTYQQGERVYVAGRPGARYSVRVQNRTNGRVMVVMSVDGVNIITGQTANFNQTGYVLEPWRSYDLSGWRKSDTEIAAFEFAYLGNSYAAKTGRPGNVGVIGMAVFQEKSKPLPQPPISMPSITGRAESRDGNSAPGDAAKSQSAPAAAAVQDGATKPRLEASGSSAGASVDSSAREAEEARRMAAPQPADKLGTAHGQREWAVSSRTDFERATWRPASVKTIEYDQYENLVAMGVIRQIGVMRRPSAFPSSVDQAGFVPDPPGGR